MRRTDDVSLWPWPFTLEVTAIVGHMRLGTLLEYQVQMLVILHDYSLSIYGPLGQHSSDWSCDLATLTFDVGGDGSCGWCGSSSSIRTLSLSFVGLAIQKIWRTKCVSINGPGDPDLWPFDLETGVRVASKVGNLQSKFGHSRPLDSRIIWYIRDGRTNVRTDKCNAYYPHPYRGHNNSYAVKAFSVDIVLRAFLLFKSIEFSQFISDYFVEPRSQM